MEADEVVILLSSNSTLDKLSGLLFISTTFVWFSEDNFSISSWLFSIHLAQFLIFNSNSFEVEKVSPHLVDVIL